MKLSLMANEIVPQTKPHYPALSLLFALGFDTGFLVG